MKQHKTILFAYRIYNEKRQLNSMAVDELSTAFVNDGLFKYNALSKAEKLKTILKFEVIRWHNRKIEDSETIAVINANSIRQYLEDETELQSLLIDCKYYANLLQE